MKFCHFKEPTKVLFTDRCRRQNFCPSFLILVDRLYTVIHKTTLHSYSQDDSTQLFTRRKRLEPKKFGWSAIGTFFAIIPTNISSMLFFPHKQCSLYVHLCFFTSKLITLSNVSSSKNSCYWEMTLQNT